MGRQDSWLALARSLGAAVLELVAAELGALRADLGTSARRLRGSLITLVLAGAVLLWSLLAFTLFLVALLQQAGLAEWAATLIVASGFLVAGASLLLLGLRGLRGIEPPGRTFERRLGEHRAWWLAEALPDERRSGLEVTAGDEEGR